jgi:hypothetical protein
MGRLSSKLRSINHGGKAIGFWCPGCDALHVMRVEEPHWTWNGDVDKPTLSPSLLVTYQDLSGEGQHERCHSFVRDGNIEFLGDCTHALAGKTVCIPDWPKAEGEYGGV